MGQWTNIQNTSVRSVGNFWHMVFGQMRLRVFPQSAERLSSDDLRVSGGVHTHTGGAAVIYWNLRFNTEFEAAYQGTPIRGHNLAQSLSETISDKNVTIFLGCNSLFGLSESFFYAAMSRLWFPDNCQNGFRCLNIQWDVDEGRHFQVCPLWDETLLLGINRFIVYTLVWADICLSPTAVTHVHPVTLILCTLVSMWHPCLQFLRPC